MIKKLLALKFTFLLITSFAQINTKVHKVVNIIEPQSFYLNGGLRNIAGGNSRTGFLIDLPPNTIEWYYVFTTEQNKNDEKNIQLINQLSFLLPNLGVSDLLFDSIKIPPGQALIDVYLTNHQGYESFLKKNNLGTWENGKMQYLIEASRTNIKSGKVKVDDVKNGRFYLVLRNTSSTIGINVQLEVVALVEENIVDKDSWNKENKELFFTKIKSLVQSIITLKNENNTNEVATCLTSKFIKTYKPNDANNLADFELNIFVNKNASECNLK